MNFNETDSFRRDFKRLSKKYRSLHDDLDEFKKVLSSLPLGTPKHFNIITVHGAVNIVKARLFCKYLKGSSLRIIYAYNEGECSINFIELYFKGDQSNHDPKRVKMFLEEN